jgi:hypothetical protein
MTLKGFATAGKEAGGIRQHALKFVTGQPINQVETLPPIGA